MTQKSGIVMLVYHLTSVIRLHIQDHIAMKHMVRNYCVNGMALYSFEWQRGQKDASGPAFKYKTIAKARRRTKLSETRLMYHEHRSKASETYVV